LLITNDDGLQPIALIDGHAQALRNAASIDFVEQCRNASWIEADAGIFWKQALPAEVFDDIDNLDHDIRPAVADGQISANQAFIAVTLPAILAFHSTSIISALGGFALIQFPRKKLDEGRNGAPDRIRDLLLRQPDARNLATLLRNSLLILFFYAREDHGRARTCHQHVRHLSGRLQFGAIGSGFV
jgi:hypothetical protein